MRTERDQLLSLLKPVEMNEYNRSICLPNTRLDVVKAIIDWITDESSNHKQVLWLYGRAGSGKSTLSKTIAWMMRDLHRLGGFFFFDRKIPERSAENLIRVLSYQLAQFDTRIGAEVSRIVEHSPSIAVMPLGFQFAALLSANALRSVEWTRGSIVIVIDALDESGSIGDHRILMRALSEGLSGLPSFIRIMVVSRQEPDIQRALGSHSHVHHLDIDSAIIEADILEFVQHRLEEIRRRNGFLDAHWPGNDKINALARRADSLFIWASTACRYIDSGYDPNQRLSSLIRLPEFNNDSSVELDRLYKTGLQSCGSWDDPSFSSDCCSIIGVILCARIPLSDAAINALLALSQDRPSLQTISRLVGFLHISKTEGIRIFHHSFCDYLSERCSAEPWSINLELHNKELALRCIKFLDKELRQNICDMTLPHVTQTKVLPEAISYACTFWIEHICLCTDATDDIIDWICKFLDRHLLHWMEALAVSSCHDHTIRSLQALLTWLKVHHLICALDTQH